MRCYTQMPYHHRSNDVYEKSVTKRFTPFSILLPQRDPLCQSLPVLVVNGDVWQGPFYQAATFRPVLKTSLVLQDTCWESSSISLTAWPTHTQKQTVNDMSPCLSPAPPPICRSFAWEFQRSVFWLLPACIPCGNKNDFEVRDNRNPTKNVLR